MTTKKPPLKAAEVPIIIVLLGMTEDALPSSDLSAAELLGVLDRFYSRALHFPYYRPSPLPFYKVPGRALLERAKN